MNRVLVCQEMSGIELGARIAVADSWWRRLRGLLATPPLSTGEGLLLLNCASVHTVGMRYAIDVAFLDANGRVVNSIRALGPWRVGVGAEGTVHTLELPPGRLEETGTRAGDRLSWS